jgi:hypothetical protein
MSDQITFVGIVVAAVGAIGGYGLKYYNDIQLEKAKAEIKFVSDHDYSEHTAYSEYPNELDTCIFKTFAVLKARQDKLLRKYRI